MLVLLHYEVVVTESCKPECVSPSPFILIRTEEGHIRDAFSNCISSPDPDFLYLIICLAYGLGIIPSVHYRNRKTLLGLRGLGPENMEGQISLLGLLSHSNHPTNFPGASHLASFPNNSHHYFLLLSLLHPSSHHNQQSRKKVLCWRIALGELF